MVAHILDTAASSSGPLDPKLYSLLENDDMAQVRGCRTLVWSHPFCTPRWHSMYVVHLYTFTLVHLYTLEAHHVYLYSVHLCTQVAHHVSEALRYAVQYYRSYRKCLIR